MYGMFVSGVMVLVMWVNVVVMFVCEESVVKIVCCWLLGRIVCK